MGNRNYSKLFLAPHMLKKTLLCRIEREIQQHSTSGGGLIQFKMNALEDADIIKALYRASMAGVKVDLIVRDTCRLRPAIPRLSENIRVISIVGRFLEHSKIYYFRNGGVEEYFIASVDAMKRNLEERVEILCPVENPELQKELRSVLDTYISDRCLAWDMLEDGSYMQRKPKKTTALPCGSHQQMIERAENRLRGAHKLKNTRTLK
jgi:polyphosphate kinase